MITESDRRTAQYVLKETVRSHTAIKKWLDWCSGLSAAMNAAHLYDVDQDLASPKWQEQAAAVERAYEAANKKPPMPSETRKHRMYDSAYRVAALVGLEVPAGSINTMDDVFRIMAAATAVLAV